MTHTSARVWQWVGIILILGLFGGAYWYWEVRASVKMNTSESQPQGTGRLDSGLTGYWKMDEGSGTSTTDSSTNGKTGTLTGGPTWTTGQFGGAVNFDGADDYITVTESDDSKYTGELTLCVWANIETAGTYRHFMGKHAGSGSTANPFDFRTTADNPPKMALARANTDYVLWEGPVTTLNQWKHYCVVAPSAIQTTPIFYINGVATAGISVSGTGTGSATGSGAAIRMGLRTDSVVLMDGSMDEARIYNRMLSADEVAQIYRLTAPTGVDTSLKGYWSFNGDDVSGTTAYDRSGSGNNGTLTNGPTKAAGIAGQALSFDGTDDYVTAGDSASLSPTSALSVSFWVKVTGTVTGDLRGLVIKSVSGQRSWALLTTTTGGIRFYVADNNSDGGSNYGNSSGQTIVQNRWAHVTAVFDGSGGSNAERAKVYVDGIQQTMTFTGTIAGSLVDSTAAVEIGRSTYTGTNLPGLLDEVRLYNRALSVGEINSLYALGQSDKVNSSVSQSQGTGRLDSSLAGYWPLDNGSGTSATDASTNGNTGTLTNFGGSFWTTGQVSGALDFDGTDDYIAVADTDAGDVGDSEDFSLSIWFYRDTATTWDTLINKRTSLSAADAGYSLILSDSLDTVVFEVSDGVDEYVLYSGTTFTTPGWHHAVITWDQDTESNIQIYVDGIVDSTSRGGTLANIGSLANALSLYIGSQGAASHHFDGKLDEARMYDRALSAEDVRSLYRLSVPSSVDTGLKGYWSFNAQDMNGTTAYDRSGVGNIGTLTNSPTKAVGLVGQALSFDGTDDYVDFGNASSVKPVFPFTTSAWTKLNSLSADSTIVTSSDTGSNGIYSGFTVMVLANGTLSLNVGNNVGCCDAGVRNTFNSAAGVITTGQWYHITAVYTSISNFTAYVNGVSIPLTSSGGGGAMNYATNNKFRIGTHYDANTTTTKYTNGLIDEVRLYNRALTAGEIKGLYDMGQSDKVNSSVSQPQGTGRLDSGLAGYWKLDDGSGTSATDASTNGNTGTLTNSPTWTTGQIGSAVDLDGTDDYINFGATYNYTSSDFSISHWAKFDSLTTDTGGQGPLTIYKGAYQVNGYYAQVSTTGGVSFFTNQSGASQASSTATGVIVAGNWYHMTYVRRGATVQIYINGVDSTTTIGSHSNPSSSSSNFEFGRYAPGNIEMNGQVDELRVYDRALSADEVSGLYRLNTPTGTDTSLKGYWSFNGKDISGTTAFDQSGAGNNGTLTNSPTKVIGKLGQALSFSEVNDTYVNIGTSAALDFTSALSLSAWVKPDTANENNRGIVGRWVTGTSGYMMYLSSGKLRCYVDDIYSESVATLSSAGDWYHLGCSWDGTTIRGYINGVADGTAAKSAPSTADTGYKLVIGSYGFGNPNLTAIFDGKIDEVRIYNRALTASEITSLYNSSR